ncbi:MAG: hypothetical protein K0R38_6689 [Polyangiaceae bacterium]|jgi:hypothetical protein|nr:hypothetical protein [Polyangiaceae bacterium]
MNLQHAVLPLSIAALVVACGGTVSQNDRNGSAGTPTSAGNGSASGASTGGTAASAGGSVATAGSLSVGGAPTCTTVECEPPACRKDEISVLRPGDCCETCQPAAGGCEDVKCQPVEPCGEGYELAQPAGACCVGCIPKPGFVACVNITCPPARCPLGYVRGDLLGGCCYDCVPDPLYCRDGNDCLVADRPRECCGCPEAITRRQYDAEACWSELRAPRPRPATCYPQVTCDAVCGPCEPQSDYPDCEENRCVSHGFGLK